MKQLLAKLALGRALERSPDRVLVGPLPSKDDYRVIAEAALRALPESR